MLANYSTSRSVSPRTGGGAMRNAVRWLVAVAFVGLFVVACNKALSPTAPDDPKAAGKDGKVVALTGPGDGGGAGPGDGGGSGPGDCGVTGPNNHGGNCGGGGGGGGTTPPPGGGGGGGTGGTGGLGNVLPAPDPGVCPFRGLGSATGMNLVSGENTGAGDDFLSANSIQGCGLTGAQDVALSWRTPGPGCYSIDTNGSSYDTVLRLYEGCNGLEFFCDDDGGTGLDSLIYRNFYTNQDMTIIVDGYSPNSLGIYTVNIASVDPSFCTDGCGAGFFAQPVNVTNINGPSTGYSFTQGSPSTGFGNGQSIYSDAGGFTVMTEDFDLRDQPFIRTVRADGNLDGPDPFVTFDFESTCPVIVFVLIDPTAGVPPWVTATFFPAGTIVAGASTYQVWGSSVGTAGTVSLGPPMMGNEMYGIVVSTS
jgi:hypothetical protein